MKTYTDRNGYEWTEADVASTKTGICSHCGEVCEVGVQDESFDYSYGSINATHHQYSEVSSCCGADVEEGGKTEVRTAIHFARRDHKDGEVKAGEWYVVRVFRYWRANGPSWIRVIKGVLYHGCEMPYSIQFGKDWYTTPEIKNDHYSITRNWARWSVDGKSWPI